MSTGNPRDKDKDGNSQRQQDDKGKKDKAGE